MPRAENVNVIESFFQGIIAKELETLPLAADVVFDSPLISEQRGRERAIRYLTAVAASPISSRAGVRDETCRTPPTFA